MRLRSRPDYFTLLKFVLLAAVATKALGAVDDGAVLRAGTETLAIELADGSRMIVDEIVLDAPAVHHITGGWLVTGSEGTERGSRLALYLVDETGLSRALPEPDDSLAPLRQGATPILDRGDLVGLAWLEGPGRRAFQVRATTWSGATWGPAQTVSGTGPGSQLALGAAVLDDGAWLLVWSAFDGHDDEIVWSRREQEYWSQPRRLGADNQVPDITPSLIAAGDGALVAWSQYDGNDYRVLVARYDDDGTWRSPSYVAAPGTMAPRFSRGEAGRPRLLYREVQPAGWTVIELGSEGGAHRRARFVDHPDPVRSATPELTNTNDAVRLRWPTADREVVVPLEPAP